MRALTIFTLIFLSGLVYAVSSIDPEQLGSACPQKFVGKVVDVTSLGTPLSSPMLEKVRVTFSVLQVERGALGNFQTLDVLKFGPAQFEKDVTYDLELSQGFLCSALKVE